MLAPGKYRISTKAGVLRANTEVSIVANKQININLLLASGQVLLRSYFTKGGDQHTSSPFNNWTIHAIGGDGKPSQKTLATDIDKVGNFRVSPGRYLVRVKAGAMRGATEVNVAAGKIVRAAVDFKAAKIRVGWDNKAITQWRVYPLNANGKPAKRYVTYAYKNTNTVHLPAGRYLVRGSGRGIKSEGNLTVEAGRHDSVTFRVAK